jgi:hypothetical protein
VKAAQTAHLIRPDAEALAPPWLFSETLSTVTQAKVRNSGKPLPIVAARAVSVLEAI